MEIKEIEFNKIYWLLLLSLSDNGTDITFNVSKELCEIASYCLNELAWECSLDAAQRNPRSVARSAIYGLRYKPFNAQRRQEPKIYPLA